MLVKKRERDDSVVSLFVSFCLSAAFFLSSLFLDVSVGRVFSFFLFSCCKLFVCLKVGTFNLIDLNVDIFSTFFTLFQTKRRKRSGFFCGFAAFRFLSAKNFVGTSNQY